MGKVATWFLYGGSSQPGFKAARERIKNGEGDKPLERALTKSEDRQADRKAARKAKRGK